MLCQQIMTSLLFFQFMANLEQSRSRIREAWSIILSYSLMKTFYLTTDANKDKNFLEETLIVLLWKKMEFLPQNHFLGAKIADIEQNLGILGTVK